MYRSRWTEEDQRAMDAAFGKFEIGEQDPRTSLDKLAADLGVSLEDLSYLDDETDII